MTLPLKGWMLVRGRAAQAGGSRSNTVSGTRLRALPAPAPWRGLGQTCQVLDTCVWLVRPHSLAQLFKNKLKTSRARTGGCGAALWVPIPPMNRGPCLSI